jgi:DNA gyrase subunit A
VRSGEETPEPEQDFIMVTRKGIIKRTPSSVFKNVRKGGMQAIKMEQGDSLGWVLSGQEGDSVIVGTASGKVLRFEVSAGVLNPVQTRSARGVKAIKLADDDSVVGISVIPKSMTNDNAGSGPSVLFVTKHGIGKRVELTEFPNQGRAGMGRFGIRLNEGDCLTGMDLVPCDERDIVVATEEGLVQRCKVGDLPILGRNTKGVKLVRLNDGDAVQSIDLLRS